MLGMRLGGIDPSILRELSGVYKPFVKAFKELVSNAFDADADAGRVVFADDFSSVTVSDDGQGMSPCDFRNDFARIGGGSCRWAGDRTRKGRLRIGSKGIGFLALARYCDSLTVESGAERTFEALVEVPETPVVFDLVHYLGIPIPEHLLDKRLSCDVRQSKRKLQEGRDYQWNRKGTKLSITKDVGAVTLRIRFNCKGIAFAPNSILTSFFGSLTTPTSRSWMISRRLIYLSVDPGTERLSLRNTSRDLFVVS